MHNKAETTTRPSTAVLLSTLFLGLAELLPLGQAGVVVSLFAPILGYASAYIIRRAVAAYEYNHFCRQIDKLIVQLRAEAQYPALSTERKADIETQIDELTHLKQHALVHRADEDNSSGNSDLN